MKEIKSILKVLESPFIDKEPLLDDYLTDQKSLVMKLAFNISNDKYSSDIEAGRDIYGDNFNKHTFEELKSKVRQRALTTLLTVELKKEHQHTREALHHKLFKMLAQAHILLSFGARPTGVKLLLKISQAAKQYSFTDIELLTIHALRLHYWFIGDKAKYDELSNALQRLVLLLSCEQSGEKATSPLLKSMTKNSRDKLGINLSALILHATNSIIIKDEKLLYAVDKKIDNYLYRYLNDVKGYKRSIAFLRLLRIVIKDDYEIKPISSKAQPYLQFLHDTKMDLEPIEIIPYEKLWILIMEDLAESK